MLHVFYFNVGVSLGETLFHSSDGWEMVLIMVCSRGVRLLKRKALWPKKVAVAHAQEAKGICLEIKYLIYVQY